MWSLKLPLNLETPCAGAGVSEHLEQVLDAYVASWPGVSSSLL